MRKCPTDAEMAAFIDGALSEAESREIRRHVAECQDCAHALADVVSVNDLETEGILGQPTAEEAARMASKIRLALRPPTELRGGAESSAGQSSSLTDRLRDIFGGAAIGASILSGFGKGLGGPSLVPAFGSQEENPDHPVRNEPFAHSVHHEGDDLATDNSNHESHHMNNEHTAGNIEHAPTVVGLPGIDGKSPEIQQTHADTCAIRSQELILRDFGVHTSEDTLQKEAAQHGWYTPGGGTPMDHIGDLLENHGVPVNRYHDANIFTLTSELAQGHKVIIGVNSGELWAPGVLHDLGHSLGLNGADHALIVSGIDTSDQNHVKVVLTDPGSGDIAKEYPLDQFIHAWKDSHCFMVATTEPAPPWLPEMEHFNYGLGHVELIGHLPYEQFSTNYAHELSHPDDFAGSVHDLPAHHSVGHDILHAFLHSVGGAYGDALEHLHDIPPHHEDPPQDQHAAGLGAEPHDMTFPSHSEILGPEPTIEELVQERLHPPHEDPSHPGHYHPEHTENPFFPSHDPTQHTDTGFPLSHEIDDSHHFTDDDSV